MDYKSTFHENLDRLIRSSGMNLKEFAEKVNTTSATLSRCLHTERIPDIATIIPICDYMNVSIDWLFGRSGDRYNGMTPEQKELVDLYSFANENDKRVIDAVLSKYRKDV